MRTTTWKQFMPLASDFLLMVGYFALSEISRMLLRMASDSLITYALLPGTMCHAHVSLLLRFDGAIIRN